MGILSAFRFAFQNLFFSPILYGVIASLAVFSTVWESGDRLKDQLTDGQRSQEDTFDFIIVGAGSAGAVLANRLSQYHTVLLLEAGGETHPFQAIPGLAIFIPKNPGTDWMHKSVTQTKSCLSCPHKKYILSQGKNLGGSGNLNYMIHLRGNPLDFDNWATITSDPSWSYEGVLPYFIQSENFVGDTSDKEAHGYGGPLQIQIPDCIGLAPEWNLAGVEMGYSHVDLNGRHSEGFDTVFYPIKRGVRQATYRSYIQPVRNRKSLLIRKFAHVNKVLIREATNEAVGVEYDRHGHRKIAYANKEVILSAGTLQTPKLLILSGVGQLEHLNALHIPVRSVLPVGKNLQDHFSTLLGPFYINKARTISFDRDIDKQSFVKFAVSGKGPLSSTGFMATAMLSSSFANGEGKGGWPDIQLTLFGLTPHRMFYSDIGHAFGIRQDILHRYYGDVDGKENAFFIMVTLARPESKGDYCLTSKDPYKAPQIDPNYLMDGNRHDVNVMVEGIHRALFLAENTTAFRGLETFYSQKCFPGCESTEFRSDNYWRCYIRHFSIASNDHVGTAPMGQVGSPYAVVNPALQVQGISKLRVVDASVMPTIVGAPTQAATIMIAEKASALILDRWKGDATQYYGVPGHKPGEPLSQYGPPQASPGPQYGAPGIKPAPVSGGDGFENYDSFSVIRDQFNPNGGVNPTALIPINPDINLWSTPQPFPNIGSTPTPFVSGGFGVTSSSTLTPEPAVVLVPPGQSHNAPSPTFATSYVTTSADYSGPILSTPATYPVLPFQLDTSRSEKTPVASELNGVTSNSTGRQGKSFGDVSSTLSSIVDGNQLGPGFDEEVLPLSSPAPTPIYYSTSSTTPAGQITEEVINQGPGFRVVRKRLRTTPRVIVHPRGHLGHQNVQRTNKHLNESLEQLFLTTSSIRPVPKEIVKIKRRRPVPNRRRSTTPTPVLDENGDATNYNNNGIGYSTTARPPGNSGELPSELKSPGKKRFVRRMYARPINFNGKNRLGAARNEDFIAQSTTALPITVTLRGILDRRITRASVLRKIEQRIDLDAVAGTSLEQVVEKPESSVDNDDSESVEEDSLEENGPTNSTLKDYVNSGNSVTPQPVIVLKNIELEDLKALKRPNRESNNSNYFGYTIIPEEGRNPIMPIDLNPIPDIIAPKSPVNGTILETVAVQLKDDAKEVEQEEKDEGNDEEIDTNDYEDYDNEKVEEVSDKPESDDPVNYDEGTTESYIKSEEHLYDDVSSSSPSSNYEDDLEEEDATEANISSISNSSISKSDVPLSNYIKNITSVVTAKADKVEEIGKAISSKSIRPVSTMSPRMFRAMNKLIRIHS